MGKIKQKNRVLPHHQHEHEIEEVSDKVLHSSFFEKVLKDEVKREVKQQEAINRK